MRGCTTHREHLPIDCLLSNRDAAKRHEIKGATDFQIYSRRSDLKSMLRCKRISYARKGLKTLSGIDVEENASGRDPSWTMFLTLCQLTNLGKVQPCPVVIFMTPRDVAIGKFSSMAAGSNRREVATEEHSCFCKANRKLFDAADSSADTYLLFSCGVSLTCSDRSVGLARETTKRQTGCHLVTKDLRF